MASARRALLAADGGPGVGLGHLQRTLALAAALGAERWTVAVAGPPAGPLRERVEAAGQAVVTFAGWPAWDAAAVERLDATAYGEGVDLLVVDTYRLPPDRLERLHRRPYRLAVIDDLGGTALACDIVVNGSPAATTLPYPVGGPRLLLGPTYALLGPRFWERPPRAPAGAVRRMLVSLGGGAPAELVASLVGALVGLGGDAALDVVVGPFADAAPAEAVAAGARCPVHVHAEVSGLRDLALAADLAVSAAGHTLLELAWAGCPTVALALAANQEPGLATLSAQGVVRTAGRAADPGLLARVQAEVAQIRDNVGARQAMAVAGGRLVDGRGAVRVARALGEDRPAARTIPAGEETA
jgi:spore coat polysaccharide biosynthesis predicted glycosyltransferase SpsG